MFVDGWSWTLLKPSTWLPITFGLILGFSSLVWGLGCDLEVLDTLKRFLTAMHRKIYNIILYKNLNKSVNKDCAEVWVHRCQAKSVFIAQNAEKLLDVIYSEREKCKLMIF